MRKPQRGADALCVNKGISGDQLIQPFKADVGIPVIKD
jgi:hypothetical protein